MLPRALENFEDNLWRSLAGFASHVDDASSRCYIKSCDDSWKLLKLLHFLEFATSQDQACVIQVGAGQRRGRAMWEASMKCNLHRRPCSRCAGTNSNLRAAGFKHVDSRRQPKLQCNLPTEQSMFAVTTLHGAPSSYLSVCGALSSLAGCGSARVRVPQQTLQHAFCFARKPRSCI